MTILEILNQYGFATLAAIAMGWFIFFIYTYITQEVIKKLSAKQPRSSTPPSKSVLAAGKTGS